jgi:hypothetical protein
MNENEAGTVLLFLMSHKPQGYASRKIRERELDYFVSFQRLLHLVKDKKVQVVLCENTLDSLEGLRISKIVAGHRQSFSTSNLGLTNKGLGELSMALDAYHRFQDLFDGAGRVIWMTGRHLMVGDQSINESLENRLDALVSNPDFYYLDGRVVKSEKKNSLNDMYFSMKSKIFVRYLKHFEKNKNRMSKENISSENLLFEFCSQEDISVSNVKTLGLLRREYTSYCKFFERSVWHIC